MIHRKLAHTFSLLFIGALVVLTSTMATAEERIVVEGFEAHNATMSVQFHGTGLSISNDTLDPEGSANLGGLGFAWRWDLVKWGGLELSFDAMGRGSDSGLITEDRSMTTVSWLWYFARSHKHRFYSITGFGALDTQLRIGQSNYSYTESAFVLGIGSEWVTSSNWMVSVDFRSIFLDSEETEIYADEPQNAPGGEERKPFPTEWSTPPADRSGVMVNVGIGYRW